MSEGTMAEGTVSEGTMAEGMMAEGAMAEGTMAKELADDLQKLALQEDSTGADETAESGEGSSCIRKDSQRGGDAQPADESVPFEGSVTCKDEDNQEVDWFILYKTPRSQEKQLTGLDYVYIHPDENNQVTHKLSKKTIDAADGILANTLRPLFTKPLPPNFGFISYNDGVPVGYSAKVSDPTDTSGGSVSSSFGHSKGVVMVEKGQKGVWLIHSTPRFPYRRDQTTFWPTSGTDNAQIFICVTFNYDQFEHIGEHLQKIRAFPFDHHIPSDFHKELQDVTTKKTKEHDTPKKTKLSPPTFQQLTSSGGKTFHSIAKQVSDQPEVGDLYVSISNAVGSDVNVQNSGCQPERDGSYCPTRGYKVQNVVLVETGWAKWDPGSDHSKWCVAVDQNKPWTCIADVNRSVSQYKRLGGALCVEDEGIRNIFMSFVEEVEEYNCGLPPGPSAARNICAMV